MANNPGPYTFDGTCTYLIGRGDVAVVDPGPDDDAHVDALFAALEPGERITHILVTHTHSDHSPAARALQTRTGAPTHGFGPQLRLDDPDPTHVEFAEGVLPPPDPDAPPPPPRGGDRDFRPDVVLHDGDVITGDGWSLASVHTPGHATNHLCYLVTETGALCTGDHIMGWATTVVSPPDGNLSEYLASLEQLLARPQDRQYLPAHGPPVDDPHTLVRARLAHRQRRSEQVLAALDASPATIGELVPMLYADVAKEVWPAAAASLYAQLLHLEEHGSVEAEDGPVVRRASRVRLAR